jgi:hypothetical protein
MVWRLDAGPDLDDWQEITARVGSRTFRHNRAGVVLRQIHILTTTRALRTANEERISVERPPTAKSLFGQLP